MDTPNQPSAKRTFSLTLDYRFLAVVLLLVIIGMLAMWRPWQDPRANDRTIEVSGSATIKAVPDEFIFNPSYTFKNADKQAALKELTKKSDEIVAKLKTLGVPDAKIKTNSDAYDYPVYKDGLTGVPSYNLRLTVTASTKDMAQKVQNYLLTTSPEGAISPQANFSDTKRKELETQARDEATKEARAKADQSAKNLGFGVGAVKTVNDGTGFGGIIRSMGISPAAQDASPELAVQPGENQLNYTVTVTYYVK